jgi:hypothetical protein
MIELATPARVCGPIKPPGRVKTMTREEEITAKSLEIAALMLGETMEGREEERSKEVLNGYLPLARLIYQRISSHLLD